MSSGASIWLLIVLALAAANLPFANQRLMTVIALPGGRKSLALRAAELVAWYFIVGGIGLWLEKSAGQIYPQGWQFYAVTAALFLTMAFPGFVLRYLVRWR